MDKRWAKLQTLDGALALHTIWLFGLTLMTFTLHTYLCMTYTAIIIMITVFPIYYGPCSVCKSSILTTANLSFSFFLARSFTRALCIISHTQVSVVFFMIRKRLKEERLFYTYSILHLPYTCKMGWLFTRMDRLLTFCVSLWQARQAVKIRPSAVFSCAPCITLKR